MSKISNRISNDTNNSRLKLWNYKDWETLSIKYRRYLQTYIKNLNHQILEDWTDIKIPNKNFLWLTILTWTLQYLAYKFRCHSRCTTSLQLRVIILMMYSLELKYFVRRLVNFTKAIMFQENKSLMKWFRIGKGLIVASLNSKEGQVHWILIIGHLKKIDNRITTGAIWKGSEIFIQVREMILVILAMIKLSVTRLSCIYSKISLESIRIITINYSTLIK